MGSFIRFNEAILPNKKAFYTELNQEDTTDEDYIHAQKLFKEFKIKNLGEHHDLYVQSDTLKPSDVLENKCIEIYQLDAAHFLPALRLAWQTCLKKTQTKLK